MSIPLVFFFSYLILGMITTAGLWSEMSMEIEMAIDLEDEDAQGFLRMFLTVIFVLAWPLVLWDVLRRQ